MTWINFVVLPLLPLCCQLQLQLAAWPKCALDSETTARGALGRGAGGTGGTGGRAATGLALGRIELRLNCSSHLCNGAAPIQCNPFSVPFQSPFYAQTHIHTFAHTYTRTHTQCKAAFALLLPDRLFINKPLLIVPLPVSPLLPLTVCLCVCVCVLSVCVSVCACLCVCASAILLHLFIISF